MAARPTLHWSWLGRMEYSDALTLQHRLRAAVLQGRHPGALLLLEHPPVITLGRHAKKSNIVAPLSLLERLGVSVHATDRGGDVTYHGPGQLVAYPVMRTHGGVRAFVLALARAAQQVLADYGVACSWDETRPGLWSHAGKVAAVGLHVSRGVSTHGIAINICPDLSHFQLIVPCGLAGAGVTSVAELTGARPPLQEVAERFALAFLPERFESRQRLPLSTLVHKLDSPPSD